MKEPAHIEWAKNNDVMLDPLSARELGREAAESDPRIEKLKEMLEQ